MNKLVTFGITQLFGGARRGQAGVAGFGAAIAIIGWMRGRDPGKQLIYKRKLKAGEEIRLRLQRGESENDLSITG